MPTLDKDAIWILRGAQRKTVFINLPKEMFMPNKLRKELNARLQTLGLQVPLSLTEMSRHVKGFERRGLIECSNEEDPYNKIYSLTSKGRKLQSNLSSLKL